MEDQINYLLPEQSWQVLFHNSTPIDIELPASVELKIVDTEPNMKGATVSSSYKPATLETGLITQIPPFIENGEIIRPPVTENIWTVLNVCNPIREPNR
ncbi:MAG: hypothetical protein R3C41_11605 [Calditrichia bacterium]